jgi:hypothetical protein
MVLVLCIPVIAFSQAGKPFEALQREITTLQGQVTSLQNRINNIGITKAFHGWAWLWADGKEYTTMHPSSATIRKSWCDVDPEHPEAQWCQYTMNIPYTIFNTYPTCNISYQGYGGFPYLISAAMHSWSYPDQFIINLYGDKQVMEQWTVISFLCVVE